MSAALAYARAPHYELADPRRAFLLKEARARFGIESLRAGQKALIDAVLAGRDALGVLPTGGQSFSYQLPAHVLPKLLVVRGQQQRTGANRGQAANAIAVFAAPTDDQLLFRREPLEVNANGFGRRFFHADFQMRPHRQLSPLVAKVRSSRARALDMVPFDSLAEKNRRCR